MPLFFYLNAVNVTVKTKLSLAGFETFLRPGETEGFAGQTGMEAGLVKKTAWKPEAWMPLYRRMAVLYILPIGIGRRPYAEGWKANPARLRRCNSLRCKELRDIYQFLKLPENGRLGLTMRNGMRKTLISEGVSLCALIICIEDRVSGMPN